MIKNKNSYFARTINKNCFTGTKTKIVLVAELKIYLSSKNILGYLSRIYDLT